MAKVLIVSLLTCCIDLKVCSPQWYSVVIHSLSQNQTWQPLKQQNIDVSTKRFLLRSNTTSRRVFVACITGVNLAKREARDIEGKSRDEMESVYFSLALASRSTLMSRASRSAK